MSTGLVVPLANAAPFLLAPAALTNAMASASRPDSAGKTEIESADDFVTTATQTSITSATFTGLLTGVVRTHSSRCNGRNLPGLSERLYCPAVGQCPHEGELAIRRGFRLARRFGGRTHLFYERLSE